MDTPGTSPSEVVVRVVAEPVARDLPLPLRMTHGAAAADLRAALEAPVTIPPGGVAMVSTGLRLEIPFGYEGQVRPRSGLAARHGVTLLNSPGTIDSDYRWEKGDELWVEAKGRRVKLRITWVHVTVHESGELTRDLLGLKL